MTNINNKEWREKNEYNTARLEKDVTSLKVK